MPQYYFDIVTYSPGDKPDPETDKIIAIQFQKIDFRSGKPLQDIEILREWKSSEEAIVTQFFNKFFRGGQNKWIFIPVGYNLNTAWEAITLKFEHYLGDEFRNKGFHYSIPHIDLESVIVLLNGGNFLGARLEKFTKQPSGKKNVKGWYDSEDYQAIEDHIKKSSDIFLKFYAKVKRNMPSILRGGGPEVKPAPKPVPVPKLEVQPKAVPEPEPKPQPDTKPKAPKKQGKAEADIEKAEVPRVEEKPSKKIDTNLPPPPPPPAPPKPEPPVEEPAPEVDESDVHEHTEAHVESPEVHEEGEEIHDVHAEEVEEHDAEAAEFAPEAVEMEVQEEPVEVHEAEVEEHQEVEAVEVEAEELDPHEAVEVEAVEAHEVEIGDNEVVEVEAVVEEDPEAAEALSPKELKKKLKMEAKKKKLEEKLRKKQQMLK